LLIPGSIIRVNPIALDVPDEQDEPDKLDELELNKQDEPNK